MKVSELITKLQEIQDSRGDLVVYLDCWEHLETNKVGSVKVIENSPGQYHPSTADDNYPLIVID